MATNQSHPRPAAALTKAYLQRYLAALWQNDDIVVTSVEKFSRGISRETWFVECANTRGDQPPKLIVRRDLPALSVVPQSLEFEYEIYRRLRDSTVPVARTLIHETNPDNLPDHRPFYLREQIDGTWEVADFFNPDPVFDTVRIAAAKEHLRRLAAVHTCDWRALGFGDIMEAPKDREDGAHAAIERNLKVLAEYQIEPLPILTEAREWLHDHAPAAPRISLLKGTNGLGEEVFRDGRIVMMSDWEQASLGDPASDLARTQDFLTEIVRDGKTLWGLGPALEYYEEVSGIHIPTKAVDYYRILNSFETVVAVHHAAAAITDGSDLSARLTWLSTEVIHYGQFLLLGAMADRSVDASAVYSTKTAKQ